MENTEVVNVAEKSVRVPKAKVEVSGRVLTFAFANGETRTMDVEQLAKVIRERAEVHGIEQKLRDSYAGAKSADEAVGLFDKVTDHLTDPIDPKWNAGRDGEPSEDSLDLLAKAMVAAYAKKGMAKDQATVRAYLETLDKSGRAKLRAVESIALELVVLKAKGGDLPEIG